MATSLIGWGIAVLAIVVIAAVSYRIDRTNDEKEFKEMEKELHIRHIERKNK